MTDIQFPTLLPRLIDPIWYGVDRPCDDEAELTQLEEEHQRWLQSISEKHSSVVPLGKSTAPHADDAEDEEEDGDADDVSDSDNDDELDTDMIEERDSADEVEVDMTANGSATDSLQWVLEWSLNRSGLATLTVWSVYSMNHDAMGRRGLKDSMATP